LAARHAAVEHRHQAARAFAHGRVDHLAFAGAAGLDSAQAMPKARYMAPPPKSPTS